LPKWEGLDLLGFSPGLLKRYFRSYHPIYKEFSLGSIATIHYNKKRLGTSEIILNIRTTSASGKTVQVIFSEGINYRDTRDFIKYVQQKIASINAPATEASVSDSSASEDFVSQLERLARLKEQGVLAEEEFEAAKRKLLEA
jgi:hypothetical protein